MLQGYYREIDEIPLRNYRRALSGELQYTRKDLDHGNEEDDRKAWTLVYDDYLREFGLGDRFEQLLELQMELIEVNIELAETGDRFLVNRANQLTADINRIMERTDGGDLDDAIAYVSKWVGSFIDERTITAKQFFKLLDTVVKDNIKQNGKANQEGRDN